MAFEVDELTPAVYTARLVDSDGIAVDGGVLETLVLTLYDAISGTAINDRDEQDVLNTNDVTVSSLGLLTWNIQILDNPIVNDPSTTTFVTNADGQPVEVHYALFRAVWDSGTRAANKKIQINVVSFDKLD